MKTLGSHRLITALFTLVILASLIAVTPQVAQARNNHHALQGTYRLASNESYRVTRNQSGVIVTDTRGANTFEAGFTVPCRAPSVTAPLGTEVEFFMQLGAAPHAFAELGVRWRPGEGWTGYWAHGGTVPYVRHFEPRFHPKCRDVLLFYMEKVGPNRQFRSSLYDYTTHVDLKKNFANIDTSQVAWITSRPRCFGQLSLLPNFHQITWDAVYIAFIRGGPIYYINDLPHTIVNMVDSKYNPLAMSREYNLRRGYASAIVTTWVANGLNSGLC